MGSLQAGYGLDRNGYIISEVALGKVGNAYIPCIQESVEKLARLFPHLLHSVYLYMGALQEVKLWRLSQT